MDGVEAAAASWSRISQGSERHTSIRAGIDLVSSP